MSEFLAMGRLFNQLARQGKFGGVGEADPSMKDQVPYFAKATPEALRRCSCTIGVGQFAKDIQFGNDMYRILRHDV